MRIDRTTLCAGYPATLVRDLLRKLGDHPWSVEMVADCLSLRETEARALVARLVEIGYVELAAWQPGGWFLTTNEGNRLALASAARSLSRSTADRALAAFLSRVETVRASDCYVYDVGRVLLFGSMITSAERVSDVDIAVELRARFGDRVVQQEREKQRINEACRAGRRFNNLIDQMFWPRREVELFLKSRSRAISIHDISDPVLATTPFRVLVDGGGLVID
jgi:hypothetical protein